MILSLTDYNTKFRSLDLSMDAAEDTASYEAARWYVVLTRPHNEIRALFHLKQQGYRAFCPYLRKNIRHARKTEIRLLPMFKNYLFLNLDIEQERWRSVNGTFGVSRLLMQDERPQPVPVGIVEALLSRVDTNGAIDFASRFKIGQNVKLTYGPFTDFIGQLEYLDDQGRVRVLLDLMGQEISVSTNVELLAGLG